MNISCIRVHSTQCQQCGQGFVPGSLTLVLGPPMNGLYHPECFGTLFARNAPLIGAGHVTINDAPHAQHGGTH